MSGDYVIKITTTKEANVNGNFLSLVEIYLTEEYKKIEILDHECIESIIHMKNSSVLEKQPPFNISVEQGTEPREIRVEKKSGDDSVKIIVVHKGSEIKINKGEVSVCERLEYEALRIRYAESQPEFTISHPKQDKCMELLEKAENIHDLDQINILYVGPDDLLNLKTILYYLTDHKQIDKGKIRLHIATSNVGDTSHSDKSGFSTNEILGVKIERRIPHSTENADQLNARYDLVIDCYTFPEWGDDESVKQVLKLRMESLSPQGYFLFVTPITTDDSLYFSSGDRNFENIFKESWADLWTPEDLTEKIVIENSETKNIYSALIQNKISNKSTIFSNDLAEKILEFNPLLDHLNDPISIDSFSLPKVINDEGTEIELKDILGFCESRDIVIHGKGGVGKSTSAKYLASTAISRDKVIPLILYGNQLDLIIKNEINCVDASIPNLFDEVLDVTREKYKNLVNEYNKILLIFDQLDDLDQEEYPNKLRTIIQTQIKNQFKNIEIQKVVMFSRQKIPMKDSTSLRIKEPEIGDIIELIIEHSNESERDKISKAIREIQDEGYPLVRSDIPFLMEYISNENGELISPNYGFYKGRTIPRIMVENNDNLRDISRKDLEKILSIIFNHLRYRNDPTALDEIYSQTKKVYPRYNDKVITEIIVSSRLFSVMRDNYYAISAHDTIRDLYSAQFYNHHQLKLLYSEKDFKHALDIEHITTYKEGTKRIISSFCDICNNNEVDFTNKFLDVLIGISKGISASSKDCFYEECVKGCLEISKSKNCPVNVESLPVKLWEFFEFDDENKENRVKFVNCTLDLFDEPDITTLKRQLDSNERQGTMLRKFTANHCIGELKKWFLRK